MRRRVCVLSAILAVLGATAAPPAFALPGPSSFATGFGADTLIPDLGQTGTWFGRMEQLGSSWVRIPVNWAAIAPRGRPAGFNPSDPADPHYDWYSLDVAVRNAAAAGEQAVLMVVLPPAWALGGRAPASAVPGTWRPSPTDYGAFARAVAARYSGSYSSLPRVSYFQAWNEPNLPYYLAPQWARNGNGPWTPVSPGIYRGLLNAFYAGAKSAQPDSAVLAAGTAPYGDPPATGIGRMYPVTFLEGLFCLTPRLGPAACPDPPHLDILDHHPYAAWPTVHARQAGDISVPDLDKIWRVVHAAQRLHRVVPDGPKSLWITEIDWESSPPPSTLASQTQALALSFYELWQQDVSRVFWFEVIDPPLRPDTFAGAGLYNADGSAKPATAAYRFPFVAVSATHHRYVLWGRAPRPGAVAVEKLTRTGWRRVVSLPTTRGGIFYTVHPLGAHLELRAVIGRAASPVWTTG